MPAPRYIPSLSVLLRWREEGLTHQEMADRVYAREGVRVTRSAVSAALSRAGETHRIRYDDVIPWERIRIEHNQEYPLTMLRLLARKERGLDMSDDQAHRLDRWLERMDEEDAVVHYEPRSKDGFYYVPRKPEDGTGYVRRPKAAPRRARPAS